jgi:hypothetical protein
MKEKYECGLESHAKDERVNGRLDKIAKLKEALKHVHDMSDEMSLLGELNEEIIALRQLREPRY